MIQSILFVSTEWCGVDVLRPNVQPESLSHRVLQVLAAGPLSKNEISTALGQQEISDQLNKIIRLLLANQRIAYTMPDKSNSRQQKYRITKAQP
jgi:ATP-dependent DNA helicase RecG